MQTILPLEALAAPFDMALIELKPTAVSKDKTRALALPYVDSRAYQDRLDKLGLVWSTSYRPLHDGAVICRLTINGISREDVGESDPKDPNKTTIAAAQAFKRACAAFGLGRYLYSLNKVWAEYDEQSRSIRNPEQAIRQMYAAAGYIKASAKGAPPAKPESPPSPPKPAPQPPAQQQQHTATVPARAKMCPTCNVQMGQTRSGDRCRKCNTTYPHQVPSR